MLPLSVMVVAEAAVVGQDTVAVPVGAPTSVIHIGFAPSPLSFMS